MASRIEKYANPARFSRLSARLTPWLGGLTLIALCVGLVWGLFVAPQDYQQGHTVRIMFIHVPSAWMAMFTYGAMALAGAVGLIWKHPLAHVAAKSCAPIGAVFTALALITGALWGQPMWGTWWVWDARLTSVLVLFFLYIGIIALWQALEDPAKAARAAAILALVGVVNLPVIKFSVDWWNTLHQPASVARLDGPSIHPSLLWPLVVMAIGFQLYFFTMLLWRMRGELLQRKLMVLQLRRAHEAGGA